MSRGQTRGPVRFAKAPQTPEKVPGMGHGEGHVRGQDKLRSATSGPERKPGEAGVRGGELMRRGDAQHRRAARKQTFGGRLWSARAEPARVCARSAVPHIRAKAQLS